MKWAAHATWYSAARASTPAHGDSLTHGSNTRRQTRVQPCSPCASLCRRRSPREPATRCSIDALRLCTSEMGCSRYTALGSTHRRTWPLNLKCLRTCHVPSLKFSSRCRGAELARITCAICVIGCYVRVQRPARRLSVSLQTPRLFTLLTYITVYYCLVGLRPMRVGVRCGACVLSLSLGGLLVLRAGPLRWCVVLVMPGGC